MKRGTLVVPTDRARQFIDLIGNKCQMQFEDMNVKEMQRPYKKYIQRIDEMERILRFITSELTKVPGAELAKSDVDGFLANSDDYKLDDVESRLKSMYQDFEQFKENNIKLVSKRNAALEDRYVVDTALASMAQNARPESKRASGAEDQFEYDATRSLLEDEQGADRRRALDTMFSNIAGVIPQIDQDRFARTMFRATRGNTFTHFQRIPEPMPDPKTGIEVQKSVFVIYFQDQRSGVSMSAMHEKIHKICTCFGVNTYSWPESREAAEQSQVNLKVQVADQTRLLEAHEQFVRQEAAILLEPPSIGRGSLLEEYRLFCVKEKSIYATLNLFEGNMNLRAVCWYPAADEDEIRAMLVQNSLSSQQGQSNAMLVSDRGTPLRHAPSYIRTNDFTAVTQTLIDTYGPPRYGEINPALFALVTFPFLFGVMYGDVGHGAMLASVGVYAVWKGEAIKNTIPTLFQARYMILMMGLFAIYCGLLYNDLFSLGLTLFGSRWTVGESAGHGSHVYTAGYDTKNQGGDGPVPFGVDPAWHGADNELIYMNSLKMKMAVILGVTQMLVGLACKFGNAVYERNAIDFFCEAFPMLVFMLGFFAFMNFLILYKWVTPMSNPPSIINSMICMAMWNEDPNPMFGDTLPKILMAVSMGVVPVMLIPKPLLLRKKAQEKARLAIASSGAAAGAGAAMGGHVALGDAEACANAESEEEPFQFGECSIHQVIFTIEYVLGTVSHTASYLRLWALSLAHQQLSLVFFGYTLLVAMGQSFPVNVVTIFLAFAVWLGITVGILLGMDVMECFLHCLRLHWVEFQSKFYYADGVPFQPYRIRSILEKSDE